MFKAVDQKSIVDELRDQIWALINRGKLSPGSKLPPEKELMKQLRVSRPAVREAIRTLVGEGILQVIHGKGTFIRESTLGSTIRNEVASLLLVSEDLEEIQDVRRILEPEIASRVAKKASEKDFEDLEKILDEMEERITMGQSVFALAWSFHRTLAAKAGNGAMARIVDVIYEMMRVHQESLYDRHFDPWEELREHRELLKHIRSREPDKARVMMRAHIDGVDFNLETALNAEHKLGDEAQTDK